MNGTVIAGTNNLFTVECEDEVTRLCSIKGKVIKSDKEFYNPIAPGDMLEIEADPMNEKKGQVLSIMPRKNTFLRWNVKGRCPQLLACNLDYLILVTTPDEPPFRPRFTDRALAQAEHQGITPVIVCNKWDLAEKMQTDGRLEEYEEIANGAPLPVFVRKIVGLDVEAVNKIFSEYLSKYNFNYAQEEFLHHIVTYVLQNGDIVPANIISNAPFNNLDYTEIFDDNSDAVFDLIDVLHGAIAA